MQRVDVINEINAQKGKEEENMTTNLKSMRSGLGSPMARYYGWRALERME